MTGGWDSTGQALTSTDVYEPANGAWLPAAALQNARAGHAAVPLPDGRVLVAAGCSDAQAQSRTAVNDGQGDVRRDAEIYDPRANAWQAAGELAEGRCWPTAITLANGRVLVAGGRDQQGQALASAEVYDPGRNIWVPAGRLTMPREGHTATLLPDGRVLVVGGYNGHYLTSAELYDPTTNVWTRTVDMGQARAYHAAALLRNGKVLVTAGVAGSRPSLDTETYHPQSGNWTPAGPLPAPYASPLITILDNGKVLLTGRPDSNDPSGNDGYPTPIGGIRTPEPLATPGAPQHAASSQPGAMDWNGNSSASKADNNASGIQGVEDVTPTPPPTPAGNVTTGAGTARLYGVHEVSFTLPTATGSPYGLSYPIIFTPQGGAAVTVKAFSDGQTSSTPPRDKWVARLYVNRVGEWTWQAPAGASNTPCGALSCSFIAVDQPGYAQLHGMLRVTSGNEGKRWYTDDGQTFLPKADTAYRLFLEVPMLNEPSDCPVDNLPMQNPSEADNFVATYAGSAQQHGINVLRALAFGNWAYTDTDLSSTRSCAEEDWKCLHFVIPRLQECLPDLSLYFSNSLNGSSDNLFDGGPEYAQILQTGFYPNLESFQRTDRKLKLLLNQYPSMYIQVLLATEPVDNAADTKWLDINATPRTQLWQNMIARWAAFPNVFWSISNDLGDTATPDPWTLASYPNNKLLAEEIGCYWMGGCNGSVGNDPWRAGRPMSMGHLRWRIDSSIGRPWHTYITAYSYADISAQEMDGNVYLPLAWPYHYSATPEPVYNTEDLYEGPNDGDASHDYKLVQYPDYFYRRLFWSHLLSGSGATYGSYPTWRMMHEYEGGAYLIHPTPAATPTPPPTPVPLEGLDSIASISTILRQARVDLALFAPHDELIEQTTPTSTWTEYDRAQVVSNAQEILAYIPNTKRKTPSTAPDKSERRGAEEVSTARTVTVDMTAYRDPAYRVTWYEPATGQIVNTTTISGNVQGLPSYLLPLTPTGTPGDVVLHISSRCEAPNACQPMDGPPPIGAPVAGFEAGADLNTQLMVDESRSALSYPNSASWRCDRLPADETGMPGCWVRHDFDNGRSVASADFYFRRNSSSSYQGVFFITTPGATGVITDGEYAISLDVWFDEAGNLYTGGDQGRIELIMTGGVVPDLNRWYRISAKVERTASRTYKLTVFVDGVSRQQRDNLHFASGDVYFRRTVVHTAWWSPTTDLPPGGVPGVWWDELSIDPPDPGEMDGLYRTDFQQGLGGYTGNHVAWFDGANGYNDTALLNVGANNGIKTLLRFNTASLPTGAVVDEATLELYYASKNNGNTLTLGAHRVLAEWTDSQVNRIQRKAGSNWIVAGMGSGSDYAMAPEATAALAGSGNQWVRLDVTAAAQGWVANPANNHGLVLLQEAASGWVIYKFCSELGWTPCSSSQTPRLVLRYHLMEPAPTKATFQQGTAGYTGNNATCLSYSSGNNNCTQFKAGANDGLKSLLRFDLSAIPAGKAVDEATLRLYYKGRSNSNTLTLGAYRLLVPWIDSQANWTQRMTGIDWNVPGLGSGVDYAAAADDTNAVPGDGGAWVELDVTDMAQAWVDNPALNHGFTLRQVSASGYVIYDFCSERGVWPCTTTQPPQLTVWYH